MPENQHSMNKGSRQSAFSCCGPPLSYRSLDNLCVSTHRDWCSFAGYRCQRVLFDELPGGLASVACRDAGRWKKGYPGHTTESPLNCS